MRLTARLFGLLASVQVGIVSMIAIGAACVTATFYESAHGAAAAQRLFYGTAWFQGLVVIFGVSILFSMLGRYPWTRHQIGFLLAHVGILLILAGSLVTARAGLDGRLALYEGESSDRIAVPGEALHIGLPGRPHATVPIDIDPKDPGLDHGQRRIPLAGGATAVIEEYRPHVVVSESWRDGGRWHPILHFTVSGGFGSQDGWLVSGGHEQSHSGFGPVVFGLHTRNSEVEAEKLVRQARADTRAANQFSFVVAPGGPLQYAFASRKGERGSGRVQVGRAISTPWMDLTVTVDQLLERADRVRTVSRAPLPERDEDRRPAVKLRLEGDGATAAEWIAFEESRSLAFAGGEATVSYGPRQSALPFAVALVDFRSARYPGSERAATYESLVRVDDPERGSSEHLIAMNRPLHYRGYTFFQSSYVDGEPAMTILSASRAPGLPMVYAGSALVSLGIAWMLWLKRWLVRRQAHGALAARVRAPSPAGAKHAFARGTAFESSASGASRAEERHP
jgi:hypothetical protein